MLTYVPVECCVEGSASGMGSWLGPPLVWPVTGFRVPSCNRHATSLCMVYQGDRAGCSQTYSLVDGWAHGFVMIIFLCIMVRRCCVARLATTLRFWMLMLLTMVACTWGMPVSCTAMIAVLWWHCPDGIVAPCGPQPRPGPPWFVRVILETAIMVYLPSCRAALSYAVV